MSKTLRSCLKNLIQIKNIDKTNFVSKILGGLQIRIGSKIIDASLKNQIEQIKKNVYRRLIKN